MKDVLFPSKGLFDLVFFESFWIVFPAEFHFGLDEFDHEDFHFCDWNFLKEFRSVNVLGNIFYVSSHLDTELDL